MVLSVVIVVAMVIMYGRIGKIVYKSVAAEKLRMRGQMPSTSNNETEVSIAGASVDTSYTKDLTTTQLEMATPPLQSTTNTTRQTTPTKTRKPQRKKAKHNFTLMFLTVITTYVLTFIPSVIIIVTLSFRDERAFWMQLRGAKLNALYVLSECYIFNHVINPFIYLYFDMKFRKEFMGFCCFRIF